MHFLWRLFLPFFPKCGRLRIFLPVRFYVKLIFVLMKIGRNWFSVKMEIGIGIKYVQTYMEIFHCGRVLYNAITILTAKSTFFVKLLFLLKCWFHEIFWVCSRFIALISRKIQWNISICIERLSQNSSFLLLIR